MVEEKEAQEQVVEIGLISDDLKLRVAQKRTERTPRIPAARALLHNAAASPILISMTHLHLPTRARVRNRRQRGCSAAANHNSAGQKWK